MNPKRHIIPVFVPHLGCPNHCVFCNQRKISGQIAPQTPETVKEQIEEALVKIPRGAPCELAFYGGSFTAIAAEEQEALLSAAAPYRATGRIQAVRISTRPDCVDKRTVERLLSYGVKTVELGVQSLDEEVLRKTNRGHTAQDAARAVSLLREGGFAVILQMMTGLPAATPEKDIATAEKIIALAPDGVRIYPTVVVRDTPLYDMWQAGLYQEHTVQQAVKLCCVLLELFEKAGIPVIRLGLNPTDELTHGAAVAGAYHPAFGELVYAERYYEKARRLLQKEPEKENVIFQVAPGQTSLVVGQKRKNILRLQEEFAVKKIKVRENPAVGKGEIFIVPF